MTRIKVSGSIINDDSAWLYNWLKIPHTSPGAFKEQLASAEGDVVVEINSPGGYVSAAAEIYESIRTYAGNIECRVVGQAASAASVIACAAKSSISPMGTFFMHNCISSASGNHNDMRQAMHAMESVDEGIMEAYCAKTGMSDEDIYALMEENTTLNARQAVEYGFIDRITDSAADLAQPSSAVTGIAASATGFVDLMAIDAERLEAMREAYENDRQASCGGGETTMEIEDIRDAEKRAVGAEETPEEPATAEADEGEAADSDRGENADDGESAAEGEDAGEAGAPDEGDGDEGEAEGHDGEDAVQAAYDRGVLAERERIAGIMDIAARVPDAMVHAALFEEPVSAEQLALQAMRAEDAQRTGYMDKARADAKSSNSAKVAADVADAPIADSKDEHADSKDEQKRMLEDALSKKLSK